MQICSKCIMDTTDPEISFDDNGVCNHCKKYEMDAKTQVLDGEAGTKELERIVKQIKKSGEGKPYDCVIGVSGGVDSTYVAYLVKNLGLRPLAVHVDNGWNSELAVKNIENTLDKLGIDLYTNVLDWEEFRDLQKSFLLAGTPDSEVPTDHAITATIYKVAADYKIKYLIMGSNVKTESIMPKAWSQGHSDWKYIKTLQKKFGSRKLKTFPHYTIWDFYRYNYLLGMKRIYILNYIDYNKNDAMETIQNELGWRSYGGKHHESIYTKFFQTYILPRKFNIDKRKGHLSTLINSGQITREEAFKALAEEQCPHDEIENDKEFVIKKLQFTPDEFDRLMRESPKWFWDYPSYENSWYYKLLRIVYQMLKHLHKSR